MTPAVIFLMVHAVGLAPDEPAPGTAKLEAPKTVEPVADTPAAPTPVEAEPAPATTPPAADTADVPPAVDLDAAVLAALDGAIDPVRVAVLPVADTDADRARRVGTALFLAVMDAGPQAVSPGRAQELLAADQMDAAARGEVAAVGPLAADHVLLAEVVELAGEVTVNLRLLHVETGAVVGTGRGKIAEAAATKTSVTANTVQGGVAALADDVQAAMQAIPGEPRYQRVAVLAFDGASPEVQASGIDRALQGALIDALQARGFLVVERQQVNAVLDQVAAGLGDESAPQYGSLLDAQAVVMGSIAAAGEVFVVSARVVGTDDGKVVGTASTQLQREGAISLASNAIETKSALDAMFRSAVAPGWGQFYNQEPIKGGVVGVLAYGGAATTVALAVASGVAAYVYLTYVPDKSLTAEQQAAQVVGRRVLGSALMWTTLGAAAFTAVAWGAGAADAFIVGLDLYHE